MEAAMILRSEHFLLLRSGLAGLLVSLSWVSTAQAQSAENPLHAMYGPATGCIAGYSVLVNGDEGIETRVYKSLTETLVLRDSSGNEMILTLEQPHPDGRKQKRILIKLSNGVRATQLNFPRQGYYRDGIPGEVVWADDPAHREYVFPSLGGGPELHVTSEAFVDRHDDRKLLSRIGVTGLSQCSEVPAVKDGGWAAVELGFAPKQISGPATLCAGALSISLREGETAQRGWVGDSAWRISGPSGQFIVGGFVPRRRNNPSGSLTELGFARGLTQTGYVSYSPPANFPRRGGDSIFVSISYRNTSAIEAEAFVERLGVRPWRGVTCAN